MSKYKFKSKYVNLSDFSKELENPNDIVQALEEGLFLSYGRKEEVGNDNSINHILKIRPPMELIPANLWCDIKDVDIENNKLSKLYEHQEDDGVETRGLVYNNVCVLIGHEHDATSGTNDNHTAVAKAIKNNKGGRPSIFDLPKLYLNFAAFLETEPSWEQDYSMNKTSFLENLKAQLPYLQSLDEEPNFDYNNDTLKRAFDRFVREYKTVSEAIQNQGSDF